jgi:hypothetical protein
MRKPPGGDDVAVDAGKERRARSMSVTDITVAAMSAAVINIIS